MSKTLHRIQVIAKIGKILSLIVFILLVVSGALMLFTLFAMAMGLDVALRMGSFQLLPFYQVEINASVDALYVALAGGLVEVIGAAFVAKKAEIFFRRELMRGTPFTFEGARELFRLGVMSMAVPAGCALLALIVRIVMAAILGISYPGEESFTLSLTLGIAFMILSQFCKYGAELSQPETEEE